MSSSARSDPVNTGVSNKIAPLAFTGFPAFAGNDESGFSWYKFQLGSADALRAAHFLRSGTTFASPSPALPESTVRRRNVGATFHRSPASVMTVTVFLL